MERKISSYDSLENNHIFLSPSSQSFDIYYANKYLITESQQHSSLPTIDHVIPRKEFEIESAAHIHKDNSLSYIFQFYKRFQPHTCIDVSLNNIESASDQMPINPFHHLCYHLRNDMNKHPFFIKSLNKHISVFIHVFIMIVFEIYFYFNYVIDIERKEFLTKINSYLANLKHYYLENLIFLPAISTISSSEINKLEESLYLKYLDSIDKQKKIKYKLLFFSCEIAGGIGIVILILIIYAYYKRIPIKWKSILYENAAMFLFLGIFEYIFFTHVILQYNPLTDQELEYYLFSAIFDYYTPNINSTIPIIPQSIR